MKTRTAILLSAFVFIGCTDESGARKVLEKNGYKVVEVGGYAFFAASKDDVYATKFKAISVSGDTVTGVVTRGLLKGSTIRFDE